MPVLSFAIYPVAKMEGPQHMCLCLRITLNHCFVELKFGFYQECLCRGVAAIIGVAVTFVTEVASNTATANIVVIVIINVFNFHCHCHGVGHIFVIVNMIVLPILALQLVHN